MENLLGVSIVAGFVLSIFIMMIIKNLTRTVYANAKELDSLREQSFKYELNLRTARERRDQMRDQITDLTVRLDDLRSKTGEPICEALDQVRIDTISTRMDLLHHLARIDKGMKKLRGDLSFHVERIDDNIHDECYGVKTDVFVESIEMYDWIAARDAEFANSCKASFRYNPDGSIRKEFGQ